jgi:outer membrane protein assembly factor BamB
MAVKLQNVVFTGFNSRVIALDQNSGEVLWDWKSPKGGGYVSLLLTDEEHLIVSVNGYTYCLDPGTGEQKWFNELPGYGSGVASLISINNPISAHVPLAAGADADAAASGASAAT